MKKNSTITYAEWETGYRPERNVINPNAPFGGCMYETYGAELDYVRKVDPSRVWTLIDGDGLDGIVSGFHIVNRLGYFVTASGSVSGVEVTFGLGD